MARCTDRPAAGAVVIDPAAADDPAAQLRRACAAATGALVLDLHRVGIVDPDFLAALGAAIETGAEIVVTGASPEVYKALHVAGLAARLRRA